MVSARIKASITKRVLSAALLVSVVLLAVSVLIISTTTYYIEKNNMEKQFNSIKQSYLETIASALWVNDLNTIKIILLGICKIPGIDSATVIAKDNIVCQSGAEVADDHMSAVFDIQHLYDNSMQTLGKLRIVGDDHFIYRQIIEKAVTTSFFQALSIVIICTIFILAFYKIVINRLLKLNEYVSNISADSLDKKLDIGGKSSDEDEIDGLVKSINIMTKQLNNSIVEKEEAYQKLEWQAERLELLVEERTQEINDKNKELQFEIEERKSVQAEREKLIEELQGSVAEIKKLSGLLPICSNCKKIRDDKGYWNSVEAYIQNHSEATFSHGICPDCIKKLYPDLMDD